ncbi:aspartyl/glutamyl-tRNA(Asn/Gln) amidotransferase subunit A [Gordonia namibiensis NBRC 108229]|uniref:Aspartyl/glutamyl-tRNA(Asn/Gln) amidotransferase subunit A n=1 Tax=Gordonia namibiensis NBRC 108229 TaxID=1208314 RepID=K6X5R9_9ACTN|nr:amidase [Gordonia namibiensis]GAC01422.1 aspartyl/glutamyl-tRNA(Asn/Gln) amidotransferase subunit A [Gordonia namibiensis NBRC 108229]
MTGTHYPDLTADAVAAVNELAGAAHTDMSEVLQRSRERTLPASPCVTGAEPADFHGRMMAYPVPDGPPVRVPVVRTDAALHDLGVVELLEAFRTGRTTPTEVLEALSLRWDDPELVGGAILATVDGRSAAAASDDRWRSGTPRPLEGIPFAVKDIIDVAASPITAGSHTTGNRIASADATVVARLRAVGAIPVLITATTEFACGAPFNARYGPVTNPWDRERWTGGSSTGSGGALAAGLVPLALGSDTGGSIRVPSALCNLSGIKPTYGLVPRTGVVSLSWTLDHVGPMARSAADLRAVLAVLAGPDGVDPTAVTPSIAAALGDRLGDHGGLDAPSLAGVRVGIPRNWFTEVCDAAVLRAWQAAIGVMSDLGAETVLVDLPDAELLFDEFTIVLVSELAANQEGALDRFAHFDIGTQVRIARGRVPRAIDYIRALRRRAPALTATVDAFDTAGIDVFVTPGIGATAPRLSDVTVEINGERHPMQGVIGRNTGVFDHLGLPAAMIPAGFADGLPVGVQLVGRPWADDAVLRIAQMYQAVTDHHRRRPHE